MIGVNFPDNKLHLYGDVSGSMELWIITVDKNVYITVSVKGIIHD